MFSNDVALGIGGSFDHQISAGVTLLLAYRAAKATAKVDDVETDATATASTARAWVIPYVEIAPANEGPVRPFLSLHAGLGSTSALDDTGKLRSGIGGVVGLGGGIHYFVNEYVSIDPHIRGWYHGGSAGDVSVTGWTFAGVLGVSAWFGEVKRSPVSEGEPTAEVATEPQYVAPSSVDVVPSAPQRARIEGQARERIVLGDAWIELFVTRQQPDTVVLTLNRPKAATQSQSLSCGRVSVVSGATNTALETYGFRDTGGEDAREQVTTNVPIAALRSLVDEGQRLTTFDACGQRHYLTLPQRNGLRAFIEQRDALVPPPLTPPPPTPPAPEPEPATTITPTEATPATATGTAPETPNEAPAVTTPTRSAEPVAP